MLKHVAEQRIANKHTYPTVLLHPLNAPFPVQLLTDQPLNVSPLHLLEVMPNMYLHIHLTLPPHTSATPPSPS